MFYVYPTQLCTAKISEHMLCIAVLVHMLKPTCMALRVCAKLTAKKA